ncbi:MAG: hypothetical protein ACLRXQ_09780 [Phascolarctobacterium faecium]
MPWLFRRRRLFAVIVCRTRGFGDNVLAVTVRTPSYPGHGEGRGTALRELKIPHFEIGVDQLAVPGFAENGPNVVIIVNVPYLKPLWRWLGCIIERVADGSNMMTKVITARDESDSRAGDQKSFSGSGTY